MLEIFWEWLMLQLGFYKTYYICYVMVDRQCMEDYVKLHNVKKAPILFGGIGGLATVVKEQIKGSEIGYLKKMIAEKIDADTEDVMILSLNKL